MNKTVTSNFTKGILQSLHQQHISLTAQLQNDINAEMRNGRLSIALQDALWQHIESQSDHACIGLDIGSNIQLYQLDALGFVLMSAQSLADAAQDLITYSPLIGEGGELTLHNDNGEPTIRYTPHFEVCREIRLEAVMASIVAATKWLSQQNIAPVKVSFRHQQQAEMSQYQLALATEHIEFNQPYDQIQFSSQQWDMPLNNSAVQLKDSAKLIADKQLANANKANIVQQVRFLLRDNPALNRHQVASKLACSERQLNRKLNQYDLNYSQLADKVRHELVDEWLKSSPTQAAIAQRLGYSDENAFAKAFKRWTGMPLSRYRARLSEPHNKN